MTTHCKLLWLPLLLISLYNLSCSNGSKSKEPQWAALPEVTDLATLQRTDFAITLENPVAADKNVIYAPTLLFAWDIVKATLKSPVTLTDSNSQDFRLLNASNTHINSLEQNEFVASAEVIGNAITANAYFNKELPFKTRLQVIDSPIIFDGTKVATFGMDHFDADIVAFTQLLFYADDDHFVLKLTPKEEENEILLIKGINNFRHCGDALIAIDSLGKKGVEEQRNPNNLWKYQIMEEDQFLIPSIKFNISTRYKTLEGQRFFTSKNRSHFIAEAYQRTGFVLNESGAAVESEAVVATDSVGAAPLITKSKKLIFDKPFLIILKKRGQKDPYFFMRVANADLLVKQ